MLNPVGVFFIVFVLTQIGLLGARVYSVFEDVILHFKSGEPLSNYPLRDKMNSGGFSYYGGLLLVMACIYGFSKWFSLKKLLEIADILAITVCIGYFFGRLGCQLSGDGCYGTYTAVGYALYRWAVSEFITSTSCTHLRNDCNRHIIFLLTMAQ
jgi:phosphatidylglycerol:prolipoprotein diacylglycerol transferase